MTVIVAIARILAEKLKKQVKLLMKLTEDAKTLEMMSFAQNRPGFGDFP